VGDAVVQHLNPDQDPIARRSYAAHFVVLALLLLLASGWAVWDEAAGKRPWKTYQKQFREAARQKFRADLEAARKELQEAQGTQEYAQAKADYEAARKAYESSESRADRDRLQQELAAIQKELDATRHRFQILRGSYQETVYRFEHTRSPRLKTELERLDPEIEKLSAQMAELQERKKAALARLRKAGEKLDEARARLAHFEDGIHQAERALAALREQKLEIRQVVNARLNLVDRCASCHLGATWPGLESLKQPFRTHSPVYLRRGNADKGANDILKDHPLETFGCSSCHQGQGYATASEREAHGELEFWQTPLLRGERVWASCQKCHSAQPDVAGVERGWEGRRLVANFGCYACHKLPGFEQEAAVRIGPNLNVLGKKVYPQWVPLWLKSPHAFRPDTKMPDMLLPDAERRAISAYLLQVGNNATPAAAPSTFPATDVAAGKELFETVGCQACHSVNGKGSTFAPDLSRVGEKVRPSYLLEWLRDPAGVQPGATMPNLRLSDVEIRRLAAYLSTLKKDSLPALDFDANDKALAERGKSLLVRYNCFGCHRIPGLDGRPSLVPDLTTVGSKLIEEFDFGLKRKQILTSINLHDQRENVQAARFAWIFNKLKNPRGYDEGRLKKADETLRMPNFHLSDQQAAAIATYLTGLTAESIPADFREQLSERTQALAAGAELIRKYNCTGCHQFGTERLVLRDGTLLKGTVKLREDEHLFFLLWRDVPAWGRRAGEITPVPLKDVLNHSPAPGGDIVPLIVARHLAVEGLSLEQAQQDPAALVKAEEARAFAPPVLFAEGRKVRAAWLFEFLNRPVTLRPWLQVRMPTFPLSAEEARILVRYFAAVDEQPYPFERDAEADEEFIAARLAATPGYLQSAQRLFANPDVNCASCHVRGNVKPQGDPSGWAPDLTLARERLRAAWIMEWLTNPQRLQPGTKMPTFFPEGQPRYQEIFPGPAEQQIRALKDYVLTLGRRAAAPNPVITGGKQ
jgi:mono/diheme cytochrome c family protein/predicted  nucleic acid-binding Zn-ribbon protein